MAARRADASGWVLTIVVALVAAIVPAFRAHALPDGGWTGTVISSTGPAMNFEVAADGGSGPAVFTYDNNAFPEGGSGASATLEFATVAGSEAGEGAQIELDWAYSGFHAFFQVTVTLEAFVTIGASTSTIPLVNAGPAICCTPPSAGFSYNGSITLDVVEGARYGFRMTGRNSDLNSRLMGQLVVSDPGAVEQPDPGTAALFQAVPGDSSTHVAAQVTGPPGASRTFELLTSSSCAGGVLEDPDVAGTLDVTLDESGQAFIYTTISGVVSTFAAGRMRASFDEGSISGNASSCIVAGPDNDSWPRALDISTVQGTALAATASQWTTKGFIDAPGGARWFKFPVVPGTRVTIDLTGLPADYDLAVFKDIAQAFEDLVGDDDVDGLNRLSAEFAPSVFSPSVFSPSVFSPSVFSPDAYAPSVFSPSVFSPSVFSPSVFSPSVFSPSVFSPSVFSPSVFSPSVFSPSVFSPSVFSPSVFSPSVFSPENFASAQTRSLISMSAGPGTGNESTVVNTWNNTGYFYVRVSGKNGAFDGTTPFNLSVALDATECADVHPIGGAPGPVTNDATTIILWDSSRIDTRVPGNGAAELAAFRASLDRFADRSEVRGVIVDLAQDARVQELHAQAEQHSSCPYAVNLTASAIKDVITAYRAGNPNLRYIVIAGTDAQVPFFRYPDQALLGPEQDYDPPVADGTHSQSALRLNYVLGQDEYGSARSLSLQEGLFPLPDLAVGRLVETAAEMNTMLEAYLETEGGVVDTPTSSLVTGYDFLTDAAEDVQAELVAGTSGQSPAARNDTLITAADISPDDPRSWTADQLRTELLDEGEDLVFLAGHFSANSTLAADYKTTALATELDASDVDLRNSIVFSAGCHSGYNLVDEHGVAGVTEPVDWAQAFARKGATLVAGTGYQYGDTDFVEYSERLYVEFAKQLRTGTGPVSVGEALMRAKQEYLASTPDLRGLHRKSVLISTVFGLPMLRIDMPGERLPAPSSGSEISPTPVGSGPGQTLGLSAHDLALTFDSLQERQVVLQHLGGGQLTATYLAGPDGVVTNPAEPALPLVSVPVGVSGRSLRGVGFRSGSWTEKPVIPLTGAPTTDLRGVHTPFASLVNFPMRLALPNYYGALTGIGGTTLQVTPAQHRVAAIGDVTATLRQFSDLGFRLFYSSNTQTYEGNRPALSAPPTLSDVRAETDGNDIVFQARVVGDPSAGIQTVWVTYTDGSQSSGTWQSLDLVQSPIDSTLWTGRLVGQAGNFGRLDFLAQAASGVGLVTVDDNFGAYYSIRGEVGQAPPAPVATTLTLTPPADSSFGDTITATATLTVEGQPVAGAAIVFSLGGTARVGTTGADGVATVDLPITTQPGSYQLTAAFAGDTVRAPASAASTLNVDKTATTLTIGLGPQTPGTSAIGSGVTALLRDANGNPLLQRTVYFTVAGAAGGPLVVAATTDNTGLASLGDLAVAPGVYTITVQFLGEITTREGVITRTDPVYEGSSASTTLQLGGGAGCPTGPVKGALKVTGDCFLAYSVTGKVTITNGTLVVGPGVSIGGEVRQSGNGSVEVRAGGSIRGDVSETGNGDVIVNGTVSGEIEESGAGSVTVAAGAKVSDDIEESGDGDVIVNGTVSGEIEESGAGSVTVAAGGKVNDEVEESGPGDVVIAGQVKGDVEESGPGDVRVEPTGVVDGAVEESGPGGVTNQGRVRKKIKSR